MMGYACPLLLPLPVDGRAEKGEGGGGSSMGDEL